MITLLADTNSISMMKQKEAVVQFRPIAWAVVQNVSRIHSVIDERIKAHVPSSSVSLNGPNLNI